MIVTLHLIINDSKFYCEISREIKRNTNKFNDFSLYQIKTLNLRLILLEKEICSLQTQIFHTKLLLKSMEYT